MLTVAKKSEDDMLADLSTELGFLTSVASFDGEPLALDGSPDRVPQNQSKYRWVVKARQVGFSLLFACEAIARCHLRDGQTSIFVSYALSDAVEKVNYARQLGEELRSPIASAWSPTSSVRARLRVERRVQAHLAHHLRAVQAPRGKKGDLYLDELAHYANDREVYKGSTALILRARAAHGLLVAAWPARGVLGDRRGGAAPVPTYSRQYVPWWLCRFFSAMSQAPRARPLTYRRKSACAGSASPASRTSSTRSRSRTSSKSSSSNLRRVLLLLSPRADPTVHLGRAHDVQRLPAFPTPIRGGSRPASTWAGSATSPSSRSSRRSRAPSTCASRRSV